MSLGGQTFFKHYAKEGYKHKINPEFQGIAKKYHNQKREHEKMHLLRAKLDKEVAYVQRLEKDMQNSLKKRKRQLQYAKEVRDRFHSDHQKKDELNEYNRQCMENRHAKTQLLKSESERKLHETKLCLDEHRRSLANINKDDNARFKSLKCWKRAKEWDDNRSRVSEIQEFKRHVKLSTDQFYKDRSSSSLMNYKKTIQHLQKYQNTDCQRIKELEIRKNKISKKYDKEKIQLDHINKELERIRQENCLENNLLRSRSLSSISATSQKSSRQVKFKRGQILIKR